MAPLEVLAIIGCGGMGLAVARQLASGKRLFLADFSEDILTAASQTLSYDGYSVETSLIDVADIASVSKFAEAAAAAGPVKVVVHTAGLAASVASARRIYEVDLLGTANVIDAFLAVAHYGRSPLSPDFEHHLATAPRDQLLSYNDIDLEDIGSRNANLAYVHSKRGNVIRVQASAAAWGRKGARVNSVSPGVISTGAGRREVAGKAGKFVELAPMGRVGTPQDIFNAVAFLASANSSFITGTDILVDEGVVPLVRGGNLDGLSRPGGAKPTAG